MCSPLPGDSLWGDVGSLPSQLEDDGEEGEMASTERNSAGLISYLRATRQVTFQQLTLNF